MNGHGRHRLPRRLAGIGALVLVGALTPVLGGASAATVPNGGFEIDGNLVATAPAMDWSTVALQHGTDGTGASDATHYQTSSKEDDPVGEWTSGNGAAPGKSDFGNYYWFANVAAGDQWAYFAWDRGKGQGTDYYALELNQKPNSTNDPARPDRTAGDIRVMVHDHGNGVIDLWQVARWNGSAWVAVTPPAGSWAIAANPSELTTAGLPWGSPFLSKGVLGEEQFIELAVDLTAMGLMPTCPAALTTVNARSMTGNAGKPDDAESTGDDAMLGKNLEDFIAPLEINLNNCANLTIRKVDQDGTTPLAGVQFSITPDPATGTGSATATTNASGVITFPATVPGLTYTVHEVAAPTGYIAAADQTVKPDPYGVYTLTFVDHHVLTDLTVKKVDAADSTKVLAGASFALWQETNGTVGLQMAAVGTTAADTPVTGGTCTTAASGTCTVTGLDFGTYYWQEVTPPAGYRMPVANVSAAVVVTAANAGTTLAPTVFTDEAQVGALAITKSNSPTETESLKYGGTITYTLTVTATGDKTQHAVVVTDVVPGYDPSYPTSGKTTYVAGSGVCVSGATCTATYDAANHLLTWAVGDMTAATPVTVRFQVTVDTVAADATGAIPGETIWNAGNVTSTETTVVPSNAVKNPVTAVQGEKFVNPPKTNPTTPTTPTIPTQVLGEQQHLPFTGVPVTLLGSLALLLIVTGTVLLRSRLVRVSG